MRRQVLLHGADAGGDARRVDLRPTAHAAQQVVAADVDRHERDVVTALQQLLGLLQLAPRGEVALAALDERGGRLAAAAEVLQGQLVARRGQPGRGEGRVGRVAQLGAAGLVAGRERVSERHVEAAGTGATLGDGRRGRARGASRPAPRSTPRARGPPRRR